MPSNLAAIRRLRGLAEALAAEERSEVVEGWLGYAPDIEPGLAGLRSCTTGTFGLLPKGENLIHETGWSRVDPTNLPLGDDGAGVGDLAATAPQAVQHIGFFQRSPVVDNEMVFITQDQNRDPTEVSHVFRLPSTVTLAVVPPRNGYAAPTFTPISLGADDFVDDATFALGASAAGYGAAAGRGAVAQPVYFFVNENNLVGMWPCFRGAVVTEYDFPIEAIGAVTGFMAASCEAFDGRMCYLNVASTGGPYIGTFPNRMVFSCIGDGANISPAVVGAGFIDADEMPGVGLRVMRLGDHLAGYFSSGIVMYVKHQPPLAPFAIRYITHQVHILGKRSVCAIDRARHFVIADQGWFIIQSDGTIQEIGHIQTQGGANPHRWINDFFATLNREKPEHVSVEFDAVPSLVRISFPSLGSEVANVVWYYDVDSDRVWPAADYNDQRIQSQIVAPSMIDPALAWSAMTASWGSTSAPWGSFAARLGFPVAWHGTRNGYVYIRDDSMNHLREKDDGTTVAPGFSYVSPQVPIGGAWEWKEARRLDVEYVNVGGPDMTLAFEVDDRSSSVTRSVQVPPTDDAGVAYYATAGLGGTHHGFRVSGTSPVALRRFRYTYVPRLGVRKHYP